MDRTIFQKAILPRDFVRELDGFARRKLRCLWYRVRDFVRELDGCLLKEAGRKTFVRVFEERLKETIQYRCLNRSVSYQHSHTKTRPHLPLPQSQREPTASIAA